MHLLGVTSGFSSYSAIGIPLIFSITLLFLNKDKLHQDIHFSLKFSALEKAIFIFVFLQVVLAFYYALFFPIEGGDVVTYHAPYAKWFFEAGRIYNVEGFLGCCNAFPHGIHLFNSWFYLLEGEADDFFIRLLAPVSSLLSGLLIFLFSKKFFGRETAFYALLVFYSIPLVVAHSSIAYFNLAEAFLEGTAFYFLFAALKQNDSKQFIASGLIGGFLPLIKPSGAIFFFITIILFAVFRPKIKNVILFFVASLLFLSPIWYLRNYLEFGNPVYPHSFFGKDKPYGLLPYEFVPFYFFDAIIGVPGGVGPFMLSFGLIGIFFAGVKRFESRFCLLWLLGVMVFTSLFTQDFRFTLLGAIPIALLSANGMRELLARNNGWWKKAVILLIAFEILPALVFGIVSFKTSQISYGQQTLLLGIGFPPPSSETFLRTMYGDDAYDAFVFIKTQTPKSSKVLSTEQTLYFIDRPTYISLNIDFPQNLTASISILKEKRIDYVLFIIADRKGFNVPSNPVFDNLNNTEYFELVFERDNSRVYKVK